MSISGSPISGFAISAPSAEAEFNGDFVSGLGMSSTQKILPFSLFFTAGVSALSGETFGGTMDFVSAISTGSALFGDNKIDVVSGLAIADSAEYAVVSNFV